MSMSDREAIRRLAVDRRKTWEVLKALKKRFANMFGKGILNLAQLTALNDRLEDVKSTFEEYTDAPTE